MIVFDLICADGHRFEGWFASSAAFDQQAAAGLLACARCGSMAVTKAVMAPAVGRKANQARRIGPREAMAAAIGPPTPVAHASVDNSMGPPVEATARFLAKLAAAQEQALADSTWVGGDFAEEARAIHYGEADDRAIHGEVSREEARLLSAEGVPCAPLPLPIARPDRLN